MTEAATVDGANTPPVETRKERLFEGGSGASDLDLRQREHGCRCDIRPGMTFAQLLELGAGCTTGDRYRGGWVCPVLDWYRQAARKRDRT